jgi:cell division protein FtsB
MLLASRFPIRYSIAMKITAPMILLTFAVVAAIFSFLIDDGFARLNSLNHSLEQQQRSNARLEDSVQGLRRQVSGLQGDPRAVEKAARSDLGMARPDEMVVIFEKKEQ